MTRIARVVGSLVANLFSNSTLSVHMGAFSDDLCGKDPVQALQTLYLRDVRGVQEVCVGR